MDDTVTNILRKIPNVNECIAALVNSHALDEIPVQRIKYCVRLYLDTMRQSILSAQDPVALHLDDQPSLINKLTAFIRHYHVPRFTRVLNGTGVIVHTNLGRSLLPVTAAEYLTVAGRSYSNLEFNLATGKRGSRYDHIDQLLCELTGAEAALVVNNNAAAVLLALETLARNKEVVVSRGQLVEIGGSFRIPDIMERSGARLIEVGATNRTHRHDYQQAITSETALLLRVHCSNYRIVGFTSEVPDQALVQLGREHGIPVMEDLGSGCFVDLSKFGLAKEPTVQEVVASGMDIVTFSGDKLLGGPQAGIIVGKKRYIEKIKRNPLNRALRIDKFTLAGLEAVLRLYLDESTALREIPTLAMIAISEVTLKQRALSVLQRVQKLLANTCVFELVQLYSRVGGGAMPEQNLASWGIAVQPLGMKINQLEKLLRQAPVPVIGRVEDDRLLLDMRTIADDECDMLFESLRRSLSGKEMRENENLLTKGQ
jgi:L-seryl-tRNA(Ser) seleniumtransferase